MQSVKDLRKEGTHPADDLKNEGEKHRGVHAVVRACHVRRRPVGPAGEHHDGTLRLSWLIHIHIIEEHDDVNIWLVNPDESDNLQEAGHPCEATKQPKATSLQIRINKNNFSTNVEAKTSAQEMRPSLRAS